MTGELAGLRVLVVDDDRAVSGVLCAFLDRLGVTPAAANDGDTAWRLLAEQPWHLLVTDLQLGPGSPDGLQLIAHARESCPGIRTILVSGSAARDFLLPASSVADRFLPKPVSFAAFSAAIRALAAPDHATG